MREGEIMPVLGSIINMWGVLKNDISKGPGACNFLAQVNTEATGALDTSRKAPKRPLTT